MIGKKTIKHFGVRNNRTIFTIKCCIILILTSYFLFYLGTLLSISLKNLSYLFKIPQLILGILLGFITSIPELIAFFESQKHYNKNKEEILGVIEATNNLFTSNILNLFVIQTISILALNI